MVRYARRGLALAIFGRGRGLRAEDLGLDCVGGGACARVECGVDAVAVAGCARCRVNRVSVFVDDVVVSATSSRRVVSPSVFARELSVGWTQDSARALELRKIFLRQKTLKHLGLNLCWCRRPCGGEMFQSERKGRVAQIVRPVHGEVVGGGALREERERDVRGADQKAPANEGTCPCSVLRLVRWPPPD